MTQEVPLDSDVKWERSLRIRILVQDDAWDAPRQVWADVRQHDDYIVLKASGLEYSFSRSTIEAIYDMHQEIPR